MEWNTYFKELLYRGLAQQYAGSEFMLPSGFSLEQLGGILMESTSLVDLLTRLDQGIPDPLVTAFAELRDRISMLASALQNANPGNEYPGEPHFVPEAPASVGLPRPAVPAPAPPVYTPPPPPPPYNPTAPRKAGPTELPAAWKAKVRTRGKRHEVYIGQRVLWSTRRRSQAHQIRKAWNNLFSHLGQANRFQISDAVNIYRDELIEASGAPGQANGFDPPLLGVGGRDRPIVDRGSGPGPVPDVDDRRDRPYGRLPVPLSADEGIPEEEWNNWPGQ